MAHQDGGAAEDVMGCVVTAMPFRSKSEPTPIAPGQWKPLRPSPDQDEDQCNVWDRSRPTIDCWEPHPPGPLPTVSADALPLVLLNDVRHGLIDTILNLMYMALPMYEYNMDFFCVEDVEGSMHVFLYTAQNLQLLLQDFISGVRQRNGFSPVNEGAVAVKFLYGVGPNRLLFKHDGIDAHVYSVGVRDPHEILIDPPPSVKDCVLTYGQYAASRLTSTDGRRVPGVSVQMRVADVRMYLCLDVSKPV